MKTKNNYFLGLIIITLVLFVFCCFTIIFDVLKLSTLPEEKRTENYMAFAYLFFHLIIVGVIVVFAVRSYAIKDQILSVFMTLENGQKNPRAYRNSLIFSIIFGILGIFFFLNSFGIIHVMKFFSLGLNLALTNMGFTVSAITLYMYFYKPVTNLEEEN